MEQQIILLYAGQYSMVDERSGEINKGTTVNYYFNTDLTAADNTDGTKGMRPAKSTCDHLLMHKILKAPALYDAQFDMKIGSDGKPVLKIVDLEFIDEIKMVPSAMLVEIPVGKDTASSTPGKDTTSDTPGKVTSGK